MIKISFYLNAKYYSLDINPDITLLELLRDKLQLTATKEVCTEGDCGACTVIIASVRDNKVVYFNVNSCIYPAAKIHGAHVITLEGISKEGKLNPIQQKLIDNYAIQCGYCTSGIILSMTTFYLNRNKENYPLDHSFLDGNLCRCTGYTAIKKAFDVNLQIDIKDLIPEELLKIEEKLLQQHHKYIFSKNGFETINHVKNYYIPNTLDELFDIIPKLDNHFKFVNGATDVGVDMTIRKKFHNYYVDISKIKEINHITENDDYFELGGNVTFQQIANHKNIIDYYPVISDILPLIASQQIRNVATVAGNIANASPIADFPVLLLVLDAKLKLLSKDEERIIPLSEFYKDYKVTELKKDEIIKSIVIPKIGKDYFINFIKSSKRKKVDISSVNSAIRVKIENDIIVDFKIAFGGVAKFVKLSSNLEEYFRNLSVDNIKISIIEKLLLEEFTPISDVRGSNKFRKTLMVDHVIYHLNKIFENKEA